MVKEFIGKDIIKKESVAYIGNNVLRKVSYIQLYNYLTDVRKHALLANNDVYKTDNVNLLTVLSEISDFNKKEYEDIPKKYSLQFANTKEKIDKVQEAIETEKIRFKNTEFDINESIYKEFENEARLKKSETDAKLSLNISKTALIISVVALAAMVVQIGLSVMPKNAEASAFETKVLQQNDSIIYLLKEQNRPDTTVFNFTVPEEVVEDSIGVDSIQ